MSHTLNVEETTSRDYKAVTNTPKTATATRTLSFEYFEKNRYGVMVALLLIVGCLGGVAVGVGALKQVFSLSILALTTMASLSMMLAVGPMKAIVYTSLIAIAADIIIILANLV